MGISRSILILLVLVAAPAAAMDAALRAQLLALPTSERLGGATTRPVATRDAFTFVAGNATDEIRKQFSSGNQVFTATWDPAPGPKPDTDGLGPLFNRASCFDCHLDNGRGRPPDRPGDMLETSLVRVSVPGLDAHGGPNPVPVYGDQINDRAIAGVPPEAKPEILWREEKSRYKDGTHYSLRRPVVTLTKPGYGAWPKDTLMSLRMANPIIGLGLLEAVPDETLTALADPDDVDHDGISGRVNKVWDVPSRSMKIGRFGWKANVASLRNQIAGAALGDMGLSNPVMPIDLCLPGQDACSRVARAARTPELEISPAQFEDLLIYSSFIAVPRQRGHDWPEVQRGEASFRDMGCAACHIPTLITAPDARPEFADQTIHPFTDLLLHDMGEGLADHRPDFAASGREWRTTPLWGLGLTQKVSGHTYLLHDGRARNVAEAILWHGGEAEAAKDNFRRASKSTRDDLLTFLNSL